MWKDSNLYGGLAGLKLDQDSADLGNGIIVRQTYAHFMAPFLMAFAPAAHGEPHPGPWEAVSGGGYGIDIHVELMVPKDLASPPYFDRLNTIWWLTALLRLKGAGHLHVPIVANRSFQDKESSRSERSLVPVEFLPRQLVGAEIISVASLEDVAWLRGCWVKGALLMHESPVFNEAFQAFDAAGQISNPSVAMLTIWGALEHLFSPAKQELRFRVTANIASFLEPPGDERLALQRSLMKLYDERSAAAHGTKTKSADAWQRTYEVGRRALLKILEVGQVPTAKDLERALFSP